jgi:hypothetical protein
MSDLVGKVERRARKPWITQEMISKMDERRKWTNVNNEEGRKEELQKNEERIEEPRTTPRRDILTSYATRSWNFKEQDVMI